ncbi:MAG: DUF2059 domain-containing protein [Acidobacterium ailaaui]|jgi:hypothetical protein|nr:DUF2059 domain-containing protein [Pseudacidobacterium ailaaui]
MRILSTAACVAFFSAAAFAQQTAAPATSSAASSQTQPSQPAPPPVPPPAHPITAEQIEEMQKLTKADEMKDRIVTNLMQYYRSTIPPFIPQDVIQDLDKSLHSADLNAKAAEIYPKYLSTEDAAKIIEFYKTPAGQHLAGAQPYLTAELQRSAVQVAQQTVKDVITRHQAEIQDAQKKYMQEQQQNKPSLNAPAQKPQSSAAPK